MSQIPLDPFISMGLICFGGAGLGWLLGPILGTGMFNLRIGKDRAKQMGEKEVEFFKRIKKYRVDGSGGSAGNPVPGELHYSSEDCGRDKYDSGKLVLTVNHRLLWREDRKCSRVQTVAQGPAGIQQETTKLHLKHNGWGKE